MKVWQTHLTSLNSCRLFGGGTFKVIADNLNENTVGEMKMTVYADDIASPKMRFLVIESANSWVPGPVDEGIGLTHIRAVAAKHQGMVELSNTDRQFRICVLLCAPAKDSS